MTLADLLAAYRAAGGEKVTGVVEVLLHSHQRKPMRGGREFEILMISDATDQLEAKDFNCATAAIDHPKYLRVTLNVENYKGAPSAVVDAVAPMPLPVDEMQFVAIDHELIARSRREWEAAVDSLRPLSPYKRLVEAMFDEQTMEDFFLWPAAVKNHHNFPGGLAAHTMEVLRYARSLAQADDLPYDPDLLTAGCLIHDIGKIEEYSKPPRVGRALGGELAYHLAFAHVRLGKAVAVCRAAGHDIPDIVVWQLMHLIEQSHGAHRQDTARQPVGKEARCLAGGDEMSARSAPTDREQTVLDGIAQAHEDTFPF